MMTQLTMFTANARLATATAQPASAAATIYDPALSSATSEAGGDRLPAAVAIPLILALSMLGWLAVWQFVEWAAWLLQ